MIHLVIMREPYLTDLLEGRKTIESRWTIVNCDPYNKAKEDHILWIKPASKPRIVAEAKVLKTEYHRDLSHDQKTTLITKYNQWMCLRPDFIETVNEKRFISLIWIKDLTRVDKPMPFVKSDRRAWLIIPPHYNSLL